MSANAGLSRRTLLLTAVGAALSLAGSARAAATDTQLLKRFAPFVVGRTRHAVSIALRVGDIRGRLAEVSASAESRLLLRLGGVRVARPPGVVWRVYLTPPRTLARERDPYFVGNVALFGAGVGDSARAATFQFPIDRAVGRALRRADDILVLTFVPAGPLVDGEPTTPLPRAELRVERLSIRVETL